MKVTKYILPWRGEFGQMLMHYVRWAHKTCKETMAIGDIPVVCCRAGDEALFPSAAGHWYDWEQVPDEKKNTRLLKSSNNMAYLHRVAEAIQGEHSDWVSVAYPPKKSPLMPEHNFKPVPERIPPAPLIAGPVDVVVCPRYRLHGAHRNYAYWAEVTQGLQCLGYVVAYAGLLETSQDSELVPNHLKTWYYDDLDSTLHLMNHAKLTLASDSGLAHLAVLNQTPLKVIYDKKGREAGKPEWPWAFDHMKGCAHPQVHTEPILGGWTDPRVVVESVAAYLESTKKGKNE